jgi:hypothetical protein
MYALKYAMVDRFANVYPNLNQFYMAGLMTAPMVFIELTLMGAMYPNRTRNLMVAVVSTLAFIVFFICIRQQTAISDYQFLKSTISHHAGLFPTWRPWSSPCRVPCFEGSDRSVVGHSRQKA